MINIEASGSDIIYWGRDSDGKVYKKRIQDFHPYFYVPDSMGSYTSCFEDKLKRVVTRLPGDVPKKRTMYEKHFEADILYTNRYSIDTFDDLDEERIKVCYLDIETESGPKVPQKFPDVLNPLNKIIVIGAYNNFTEKYKLFCLCEETDFDECEVEYFDDEIKMIKAFCKFIRSEDFDLFTGYYIEKFDMMYIINRMKKLGMDMKLLSRDSVQSYIDDYNRIHIWGRDVFDVYWGIRNLKSGERKSWKLNDVGQQELGYGKEDYEGELWELWERDKTHFLKYNFVDVKLLVDLDKKYSMIRHFDEIRRISKCGWGNVFTTNIVNDCLLLQFCKGRYVLPSVSKRKKEAYEGAHTEVYGSGVFKNVLVFDYKALYPTIMMLYNISFETISTNFNDIPIGNGVYFRRDKLGIVPELLYSLLKRRLEYQRKMKEECSYGSDDYLRYKSIQKAYKIFMNSMYGIFGYVGSRIYNTKCAESVTFPGKKIILRTIEVAGGLGLKVLYAHTDSIYFVIDDDKERTPKELKKIGEELSEKIEREVRKILPKNDLLPGVSLDLEFEKIRVSSFFDKRVRNRNAGLVVYDNGEFLEEPKLEVTGFQSIRSDTPTLIQDLLNKVFTMVLKFKSEEDVLSVVTSFGKKFMGGKFDISDISIPIGIKVEIPNEIVKGLPYHVKGAVCYNKYYDGNIKRGDKVKVVYVKTNSRNIDAISFTDSFPKNLEVDYKKMWNRYKKTFVDIFNCLNWYSLKTGSHSLSSFKSSKIQKSEVKKKVGGLFNFQK